jgi:hypothetical protein
MSAISPARNGGARECAIDAPRCARTRQIPASAPGEGARHRPASASAPSFCCFAPPLHCCCARRVAVRTQRSQGSPVEPPAAAAHRTGSAAKLPDDVPKKMCRMKSKQPDARAAVQSASFLTSESLPVCCSCSALAASHLVRTRAAQPAPARGSLARKYTCELRCEATKHGSRCRERVAATCSWQRSHSLDLRLEGSQRREAGRDMLLSRANAEQSDNTDSRSRPRALRRVLPTPSPRPRAARASSRQRCSERRQQRQEREADQQRWRSACQLHAALAAQQQPWQCMRGTWLRELRTSAKSQSSGAQQASRSRRSTRRAQQTSCASRGTRMRRSSGNSKIQKHLPQRRDAAARSRRSARQRPSAASAGIAQPASQHRERQQEACPALRALARPHRRRLTFSAPTIGTFSSSPPRHFAFSSGSKPSRRRTSGA